MKINQENLHKLFIYNKDNGSLTRKINRHKHKKGEEVGNYQEGYKRTTICKKPYLVHRLIWIMEYGVEPKNQIDHINHIRDDNRLCNLREVTNTENQRNSCISTRNTSETVGVHFRKDSGKWIGRITVNKKRIQVCSVDSKEDAIRIRKEAEIKYGFHKNHAKEHSKYRIIATPSN